MFELNRITKSFDGVRVLQDVSLVLRPGDRVGLTGGNGTGKSTLINIATGFLEPSSGRITLDGQSLNGLPPWKFSRLGIRRSFQTARLIPTVTVRDQFRIGNAVGNLHRGRALIEKCGLSEFLDLFPFEVPLPVLRKVEVVRALLADPAVMFLDEPSAGLSPAELTSFARFISENLHDKTALMIVEHRQDLMRLLVENIVTLDRDEPGIRVGSMPMKVVGSA